jgi:hypothetical protein
MQRLYPNGVPVVILHKTGSPYKWMINFDNRSLSVEDSFKIATVRAQLLMMAFERISIGIVQDKEYEQISWAMNGPIKLLIGDLIVKGVATIQETVRKYS